MTSTFIGWICRTMTETSNGWKFKEYKFATEEEARECGFEHNRGFDEGDLSRTFEVYKDYENTFWRYGE